MRLSVCADILYTNIDFYDRFKLIKTAGADAIEFWGWCGKDIEKLKKYADDAGIKITSFTIDSSDEVLSKALPENIPNSGDKKAFLKALEESIEKAKYFGADTIVVVTGNCIEGKTAEEQIENVKECLEAAEPFLKDNNITLLLEPINTEERPKYLMPYITDCLKLIKEINSDNIKVLYDIYHQNMMGDFDLSELIENIEYIGHIHIADVPGRHEPGTGVVDYETILREIAKTGYSGYIGLEYLAKDDDTNTIKNVKNLIV